MAASRWLLPLLLASTTALATELCGGVPRKIASDMQIQESDLTAVAAAKAALDLEASLKTSTDDTLLKYAEKNRAKIIRGYTLRQVALDATAEFGAHSTSAKASIDQFCSWLVEEGFWYD